MQVMCELNVLAFQTDTTRVSTYIGSTLNGISYPELGFTDTHHSQTHHNNKPEQVAKVAAIAAFNIAQFAYMVKKMPASAKATRQRRQDFGLLHGLRLQDRTRQEMNVFCQFQCSRNLATVVN